MIFHQFTFVFLHYFFLMSHDVDESLNINRFHAFQLLSQEDRQKDRQTNRQICRQTLNVRLMGIYLSMAHVAPKQSTNRNLASCPNF